MIHIERDETERVVLPKAFLEDSRLSLMAKGLLGYLLSRPTGFAACMTDLVDALGEDEKRLRGALENLERAGYFTFTEAGGATHAADFGSVHEVSRKPTLSSPVRVRSTAPAEARIDRLGDHDAIAERVMARLNDLREKSWTWARYTPLSTRHVKKASQIHSRLREGYSESDLVLVLEYRAAVDAGDENSRKYYDAGTLFNSRNFERNLGLARDWDARGRPRGRTSLEMQRSQGHDPEIYEQRVKGPRR
ncbi:MAG: hypothetical protein AB1778_07500 [Candidatus Bipolaricaulota bacterium]